LYSSWQHRLNRLLELGGDTVLAGGLKGLEKESLRVTPSGDVAQTPHPPALGSALTHPHITTDYSEALLEFITAPHADVRATLQELHDIHAFVYRNLDEELLWATSMPCVVGGDASIPIARYGSSNVGRMKHIYRVGLDYRYGRLMQAISGVHFNFSLPTSLWPLLQEIEGDARSLQDFQSDGYFRLIRNFQRYGWLIPYLFGASPAVCRSFLKGRPHSFEEFDTCTLYAPYATSLRMSDIGYKNKAQAGLKVSYDSLDAYVANLSEAIETPDPEYAALGIKVDGEWRQLNGNVLQIENEYYSFVRPKNLVRRGERPSLALRRRGVEYVEVRALDVNVYAPLGVDEAQLRFIEALLLFCLLEDSPRVGPQEQADIDYNQGQVARQGRRPGLTLRRPSGEIALQEWGLALLEPVAAIAEALDADAGGDVYRRAVAQQREALLDPERTPSARMLAEMRARGESFTQFATRLSRQYAVAFREAPLAPETAAALARAAEDSLAEQAELEAADALSFEQYLERYFTQR
jgi:glutamate--cysteine ligase